MKTFYLEIENRIVKESRKVERSFLWYDSKEKKLQKITAGSLSFVYDLNKQQLVPKAKKEESVFYKKESTYPKIQEWINNFSSVFDIEINKEETDTKCIAINVHEDLEDQVSSALDRYNIRYS